MAVTTRAGKQTIDPLISFEIEIVVERDDNEIEVTEEFKNATEKEVEVTQKVVPMPRPPPPFPQRLVKKSEEGKYHRFITILKQLSINVPLIKALEQTPGYEKFMKDLVTKKRAVSFESDERLHNCSVIATRFMKQKSDLKSVSVVNHIVERGSEVSIEESSNGSTTSSSKSDRIGDSLVPPRTKPPAVAMEPNRWLVTEERRVLTGSLHIALVIKKLFRKHRCEWMALPQIATNGERIEWVRTPSLGIKKATLNFAVKFFWLLVRNRVSPTQADNVVIWDRAMMVATMVAGLEQELASLRVDINALLAPPVIEPESASTAIEDDGVLVVLFSDAVPPYDYTCAAGKHPLSGCTADDDKAQRSRKRERQQTEVARRASIVDEELRQQRVREIGVGSSSGVSPTKGAVRVDMSTTEGVLRVDVRTTEM
uniref:Integrase core domain containing protein n=1 Tax=Solanum tuberosum TaxID=4113 RepID=M1DL60_SOLTU